MELYAMNDENPTFKCGEKVHIKGLSQAGEVLSTLRLKTRVGFCELVWVKTIGGKVDGFSPCALERLRSYPRRAA